MASLVLRNALERPGYCPYCLRCRGLVRMRLVGHMHWRCHCGAEHDERACREIYEAAKALRARKPDGAERAL
jgi:hypothetical protein